MTLTRFAPHLMWAALGCAGCHFGPEYDPSTESGYPDYDRSTDAGYPDDNTPSGSGSFAARAGSFSASAGWLRGDLGSMAAIDQPMVVSGWSDDICIDFYMEVAHAATRATLSVSLHPADGRLDTGDRFALHPTAFDESLGVSATVGDLDYPTGAPRLEAATLRVLPGATSDQRHVVLDASFRRVEAFGGESWSSREQHITAEFEVDAANLQLRSAPSYYW